MLSITQRTSGLEHSATITLTLAQRMKSRMKAILDDGREAALVLMRGSMLRDGDLLVSEDGLVIKVIAAAEDLSVVRDIDPLLFARAAYHLGNRHALIQIQENEIRYLHDHVLDDMLRKFGINPEFAQLPFDPEPGAYGDHGMDHAIGHTHGGQQGKIHHHH